MLLESEADLEVVGEAEDARRARVMAGGVHPEIVLIDLRSPDLEGLEAIASISFHYPGSKVLVLTLIDDVATMLVVKQSGAEAVIAKHTADATLLPTILQVARGS